MTMIPTHLDPTPTTDQILAHLLANEISIEVGHKTRWWLWDKRFVKYHYVFDDTLVEAYNKAVNAGWLTVYPGVTA